MSKSSRTAKSIFSKASKVVGAFLLSGVFLALGFWQLDRAAQVKELDQPYQELPVIGLSEITQPKTNLAGTSVNRIVEFSGSYVAQYLAPNQIADGKRSSWNVALMEVDGGGLILVVRGSGLIDLPRGDVKVTGRLLHRQFEDVAPQAVISNGELRRIDPALLLAEFAGDYFDGYVVATAEIQSGQSIQVPRIPAAPTRPTVPGYYWQHIAYVVIWWLMAGIVLFLPSYASRRERNIRKEL